MKNIHQDELWWNEENKRTGTTKLPLLVVVLTPFSDHKLKFLWEGADTMSSEALSTPKI